LGTEKAANFSSTLIQNLVSGLLLCVNELFKLVLSLESRTTNVEELVVDGGGSTLHSYLRPVCGVGWL
jgi:hypothetical protein